VLTKLFYANSYWIFNFFWFLMVMIFFSLFYMDHSSMEFNLSKDLCWIIFVIPSINLLVHCCLIVPVRSIYSRHSLSPSSFAWCFHHFFSVSAPWTYPYPPNCHPIRHLFLLFKCIFTNRSESTKFIVFLWFTIPWNSNEMMNDIKLK
jgi:hypothetical protein